MRAILITLVLALVAFAGCSDSGGDASDDSTTGTTTSGGTVVSNTNSGSNSGSGTGTTSSSAAEGNQPPVINSFGADVVNGTGPLLVTFTYDALDPEGDALYVTLDTNDDGVFELDTDAETDTFTHTYTATGSYIANLTVSDGEFDVFLTIQIDVTDAPVVIPEPVTITGGGYADTNVAGLGTCLGPDYFGFFGGSATFSGLDGWVMKDASGYGLDVYNSGLEYLAFIVEGDVMPTNGAEAWGCPENGTPDVGGWSVTFYHPDHPGAA